MPKKSVISGYHVTLFCIFVTTLIASRHVPDPQWQSILLILFIIAFTLYIIGAVAAVYGRKDST